ncbi:MAG TPA: glycosyltransferase family 4 protein, partial [Acidimicrobiales bacterium]|nr:glycosyltransferase family 4 protein [Acidimicrobiales bacterium]
MIERSVRVSMVCPYSLSRPGGVQGQAAGLARSLRRLGHEVALLAPDGAGPLAPGDGPFDGTWSVGRSVGVRANGSVAPVALSPSAALRLSRFAARHRADVVHLHEPLAPVAGYGCLLSRPAPMVGTYHRAGTSRWSGVLRPVAGWGDRRLDVACAVSAEAAATAGALTGRHCEVLFNGVEVDRFARAEPWPTEVPTVLFLGRHEPRKGLATLLDAFTAVPDPVVLWVAGDGPETLELERRHPPGARIRWLGVLSDDEVARRLAGAHVLCAPSLGGESFGMVLLEAMAAGCAVVASDIPGYRAAAGGHASLVAPGDPAALARALTEAVAGVVGSVGPSSPPVRSAAFAHAEGWSMDRLAARYVDLYRRATERRSATPGGRRRPG